MALGKWGAVATSAALMVSFTAGAGATTVPEGGWFEGAVDCAIAQDTPKLEVHSFAPDSFVMRQGLCETFEAPLIYLLVGQARALLIDTGALEGEAATPLVEAVEARIKRADGTRLPLTVIHSHGHADHKAGDAAFNALPDADVIGATHDALISALGLIDWPEKLSSIGLGERTVHIIPTPGHHDTHLSFYDEGTATVFTGDFLLPGRLMVSDIDAYRKSAHRLVDFLDGRPVARILGAHVEMSKTGELYSMGSQYHPSERDPALARAALSALPARLEAFGWFYASYEDYSIVNPFHFLAAIGAGIVLLLGLMVWAAVCFIRKRRRA